MTARAEKFEAVVLRMVPYGEADAVVGFLTAEHGKLSAFAPSARKSVRRFGGALDLFSHLRVDASPPRNAQGSLWRLSGVELVDAHVPLRVDLARFACANYLAECLWSLAGEGDPQRGLFEWWRATLTSLEEASDPSRAGLAFDLELLSHCGFRPRWDLCAECGGPPQGRRFFFSFEQGGVVCERCRKAGEGQWIEAGLLLSFSGGGGFPGEQGEAARRALDAFMTYTLGRPPRSQSFRAEVLRGSR